MKKTYLGAALIVLSAFGYGLMPIFAVYAYNYNINVSTLLLFRFSTASVAFFVYIALKVKKISIGLKDVISFFILGGICFTAQASLFLNAVRFISPSLAELLLYTSPMFVSILSFAVFRERLRLKSILGMIVSFSGLVVITSASAGSINLSGMMLASIAAVVYSVYIVFGNYVVKQQMPIITSAFITLFAAFGILVTGLLSNDINFDFNPMALFPVAGIALFSTIIAIYAFFKGLEYLGATRSSILGMLEPIFTILFAYIMLHDVLTLYQFIGGGIVLGGAALVVLFQRTNNIKSNQAIEDEAL
ncbi:MAG: DMT family transporter [Clostridiales bacterium]|nr:DMT family transporter [Clostridiales bacterium]